MRRIVKIICLAMALVLLLPTLCACRSKWDKEGEKKIGECAGYDGLFEELRFVTLYYKDSFAATYGEDIWDTPESAEQYREELEAVVWDMMLNNYAVLAACAQYRITKKDLESDAIQNAVNEQISEVIAEEGGKEAFEQMLKEHGGVLGVNDKSEPQDVARLTGMSKKVFKRALGMLLKQGKVRQTEHGIEVIK
jgi:hypothetical protein